MAVTRGVAIIGLCMVLFLFLTANVIAQSVRERFAEFATSRRSGFPILPCWRWSCWKPPRPAFWGRCWVSAWRRRSPHHAFARIPAGFRYSCSHHDAYGVRLGFHQCDLVALGSSACRCWVAEEMDINLLAGRAGDDPVDIHRLRPQFPEHEPALLAVHGGIVVGLAATIALLSMNSLSEGMLKGYP